MRVKKRKKTYSRKRKTVKRKRRNPMLLGNPRRAKRRSYRRRRNPGFGKIGNKIPNILMNAGFGVIGAAGCNMLTNGIVKLIKGVKGTEVSSSVKNWLSLGSAILISVFLPKVKVAGKYADAIAVGAGVSAGLNIVGNTFGMKKFLTLEGEDNPELDRIISNLNVSGEDEMLLGYDGMMTGITDLSGIMEVSGDEDSDLLGIDDNYDF